MALNLALNLAFMVPLRHVGPALATSLAAIFNVGWLGVALHRQGHLQLDAQIRRRLPRMVLAAVAMAVALYFAADPLFAAAERGRGLKWAALALLVTIGFAVYADRRTAYRRVRCAATSGACWRGGAAGSDPEAEQHGGAAGDLVGVAHVEQLVPARPARWCRTAATSDGCRRIPAG